MEKLFIGVDIGGTNVKCGVIDRGGRALAKKSFKTDCSCGGERVIEGVCAAVDEFAAELGGENLCAIGVGVPGLVDSERGVVVCSGNLEWYNVDLETPVKKRFGVPVKIANDANAAALGEARFGAGSGYSDSVMLTLGTGVGSGIIIGGKIFAGTKSAGAEIGHMVIEAFGEPCTCGGRGCFEAYASATALKALTRKKMLENPDSKMWEIGGIDNVSGKTAFLYSETDSAAAEVVERYVNYLSVGIVNIANVFRPEAIILGGGVSYEGEKLLRPLKRKLKENIFAKGFGPDVELILATLRNDAGFMGAAALNMEV